MFTVYCRILFVFVVSVVTTHLVDLVKKTFFFNKLCYERIGMNRREIHSRDRRPSKKCAATVWSPAQTKDADSSARRPLKPSLGSRVQAAWLHPDVKTQTAVITGQLPVFPRLGRRLQRLNRLSDPRLTLHWRQSFL